MNSMSVSTKIGLFKGSDGTYLVEEHPKVKKTTRLRSVFRATVTMLQKFGLDVPWLLYICPGCQGF